MSQVQEIEGKTWRIMISQQTVTLLDFCARRFLQLKEDKSIGTPTPTRHPRLRDTGLWKVSLGTTLFIVLGLE